MLAHLKMVSKNSGCWVCPIPETPLTGNYIHGPWVTDESLDWEGLGGEKHVMFGAEQGRVDGGQGSQHRVHHHHSHIHQQPRCAFPLDVGLH